MKFLEETPYVVDGVAQVRLSRLGRRCVGAVWMLFAGIVLVAIGWRLFL